jgi:hypothetical protein
MRPKQSRFVRTTLNSPVSSSIVYLNCVSAALEGVCDQVSTYRKSDILSQQINLCTVPMQVLHMNKRSKEGDPIKLILEKIQFFSSKHACFLKDSDRYMVNLTLKKNCLWFGSARLTED